MNEFDRRRIAVASLITVSVLALVWVFSSGSSNGDGTTTTCVGCPDSAGNSAPSTTEYEPYPPLFVGGEDDEIEVEPIPAATAPEPNPNEILTTTQFLRYGDTSGARRCSTMLAPEGYELTVTNVDNGQSTTCTNTQGFDVPPGVGMVLDTNIFAEIGDLTDAPLPVRVSWEDEPVEETVDE